MSRALKAALEQHAAFCARKLGPIQPDWYVFPLSNTDGPVDPSGPATSLKTAWETVRTAANVGCRFHDLRHSFCTKLGEAGVPERTMLDMMGHVSRVYVAEIFPHSSEGAARGDRALEGGLLFGVPKESPKVAESAEYSAEKSTTLIS